MKDEIKEILDSIKYAVDEDDWFEIEGHFLKPLLDYITNLQEEKDKQLDKYKNVIDKIKEEIEIFNSVEYNVNNFTILSLITKINELLEEVDE